MNVAAMAGVPASVRPLMGEGRLMCARKRCVGGWALTLTPAVGTAQVVAAATRAAADFAEARQLRQVYVPTAATGALTWARRADAALLAQPHPPAAALDAIWRSLQAPRV
jgi:hypothetical protein